MPSGFVGVSLEYQALHVYTGRDPGAVDPVLVALLRQLAPGQAPVLRIGGDSTDATWWPVRGVIPPGGVTLPADERLAAHHAALAPALGARLIIGINLAAGRPASPPPRPARSSPASGGSTSRRSRSATSPTCTPCCPGTATARDGAVFARVVATACAPTPQRLLALAGGAAELPARRPGRVRPRAGWAGWAGSCRRARAGGLRSSPTTATRCWPASPIPTSPAYPSIANLLSDSSSTGLAQPVAPYVTAAHARGLQFRLGEMNSAACKGARGQRHVRLGAVGARHAVQLRQRRRRRGQHPHAAGRRLRAVHVHAHRRHLAGVRAPRVLRDADVRAGVPARRAAASGERAERPGEGVGDPGPRRHDPRRADQQGPGELRPVQLQLPGAGPSATGSGCRRPASSATDGVTLGGQTFGDQTTTGLLPGALSEPSVSPLLGSYSIDMAPASAVMLTL